MFRFIPMKEVVGIVNLSRAQIYRMMKTGEFPPSTFLTKCRSAHRSDLVENWMKERPFVGSNKGGLDG